MKANPDLVARAWLSLVLGPVPVAATLPRDVDGWRSTGFVQHTNLGGPSLDTPLRLPLIRVDCWAASAVGSTKPPWGQASDLAERVVDACHARPVPGVGVLDPSVGTLDVEPVVLSDAHVVTDPRRVPGDPSGHARVSLDVQLVWSRT